MAEKPPTVAEIVGRNLEARKEVERVPRTRLAAVARVSVMTVTRTVQQGQDTSVNRAMAMAEALDIAPNDLFDPEYQELLETIAPRHEDESAPTLRDFEDERRLVFNEGVALNVRTSFDRRADWLHKQLDDRLDREREQMETTLRGVEADPENSDHSRSIIDIDGEYLIGPQWRCKKNDMRVTPEILQAVKEMRAMVAADLVRKTRASKKPRREKLEAPKRSLAELKAAIRKYSKSH